MKIAVGLSGGVDSSIAALILKEQGHDVIGVIMQIYSGDLPGGENKNACYGPDEEEDIAAAENVSKTIGIPFHVIDLRKEYRAVVLDYFRSEYARGRTPNPCVRCNAQMKFGFLISRAHELGIDFSLFATGHYARVENADGRYILKRAVDGKRDQSYFLGFLTQEILARVCFPLGAMGKDAVRAKAKEYGLFTHDKPDSQDFAGGDYKVLIGDPGKSGEIKDVNGNVLGTHNGIANYTIGQRRGLGIAHATPLYVVRIDAETNSVIVGNDTALFRAGFTASDMNYIAAKPASSPKHMTVKIRSTHEGAGCTVYPEENRVRVVFDEPERAVTPGQAAVFYDGDEVIGAGIID
ncbi:MAG: tRNA 2-thiouridine(34) synthase MnmA [Spirochaetes bacterium]|nr:tRNA 2-thiouridine(34) synthase MnmA [Spirochaetota bacterium]